ncbi:MAG: prepilin-type N-terminal cleavage/methylation domain-containing protein [Cyclobacteriaceae bacterium]
MVSKGVNAKKLPGFTLLELLIVLILTGVLMSLVSGTFYYLFVYQQQVEKKSIPVNTAHRLDYLLRLDMDRAVDIKYTDREMIMNLPQDTVTYVFGDEMILRGQSTVADTFAITGAVKHVVIQNDQLLSFELTLAMQPGSTIAHFYRKAYDQTTFYR